jgi:polysaccharide export outer membrane protein
MPGVVRILRFSCSTLVGLTLIAMNVLFGGLGPSAARSEESPQKLSAGDRIQITVLQQPDFSGDFVIDQSGAVILPVVGTITIKDLALPEAEKQIVERLADILERPIVSIKLNEHRPIYILGDVRNPGSHPYRYRASVLTSVASAGGLAASGLAASEQATSGARSEFLRADERLSVLQATHRTLFIRVARLEAQQAGSSKIDLPDTAPYSRDDPGVARILHQEQSILSIQKAGYEQAGRLLRAQKPRLEAEIAGIRSQAEAEANQLRLLQEHIADYNKLITTGLARRYTVIELQREEARHKGNLARFAAELARLDNSIGEVALRIQEAENNYMQRVITELQDSRTRLLEVEISMPIAQELREARLQGSSPALVGATTHAPYSITILRTREGVSKSFQADWATLVVPGDIIEVRWDNPSGSPASAVPLLTGVALQTQEATDASGGPPAD